ncbi:glutathione S-transferase 1-like [Onthophagus taurus]|uniref:glutathione S-transferase 1-like n=1 Tax=Onthophagus taurus TaxID=166361 RepID=UPI000C1FF423|nr:glutathione S-transferase 1-like [Onthophagus taurus]
MGVTIYHFPWSAPSRAALLTAKTLGIDVDVQIVDLVAKEQLKSDFLKINPQHCVPTLVDGDFILWESRAISAYLVNSYGKDDSLYPKDIKKRAVVDQRLQFDCGTLYPRIRAICFPILFLGEIEVPDELKTTLDEAIGFLDVFLDGNNFVAGNSLTIADIALVASLSSIVAVGWDVSAYGNVSTWLAKCSLEIPHYSEINQKGADLFGKAVKSKMAPGQI